MCIEGYTVGGHVRWTRVPILAAAHVTSLNLNLRILEPASNVRGLCKDLLNSNMLHVVFYCDL